MDEWDRRDCDVGEPRTDGGDGGSRDQRGGDDGGRGDRGPSERTKAQRERENPLVALVRDIVISVAIVGGIAVVLFGVSGIWPPMVAIESPSMEPHMSKGDLVFVVNETRFQPDGVDAKHGIVTRAVGEDAGYERFGAPGDVIVYAPNGNERRRAVIHRVMRWVERGERWTDTQNETHTARHAGFLTRGDANPNYDQAVGISGPVRPAWIRGKAKYSVPVIGNIRLLFPFTAGPVPA
jgi:signal peptidase